MQTVSLTARFDGRQILLDEPFELAPDTRLLVTVLAPAVGADRSEWFRLAGQAFNDAYAADEYEYTAVDVKTPNPDYDGR